MTAPDAVSSGYRALAERAWRNNQARAAELDALLSQTRSAGTLDAERRERVRAVAHSLRGSAGTFGHEAAADAAADVEELAMADGPAQLEAMTDLVARIHRALAHPPELRF